jgi:phenylalanyl-tRNA synthetase beta chain
MKISLSWLKDYLELEEQPEQISKLLTSCGLEVEEVQQKESVKGGLRGLVIGKVVSCRPHPNADKLSLTQVDVGEAEPLSIVCGAPNVAEGQKVIVATVGAELFPTVGEPFKISKSKIRGELSQGMICAEDEIGLGSSHEGIMVLDTDLPVGTPAAQYFGFEPDYIFTIGLTPNRADAASHFGVARDLAALLNRPLKSPFPSDIHELPKAKKPFDFSVEVLHSGKCPRYSAVALDEVSVGQSPDWLKKRLESIGLKPINNVVDITNYVLHSVGQPLHAFDADKIDGQKILVKTCPDDTSFVTLDGTERKLKPQDLMICDSQKPMCIAGVFGGLDSGISDQTKRVVLESAYFAPDTIRKTAQEHKLKTDASFRYERGTDPNITVLAAQWAAKLLCQCTGAKLASQVLDVYPCPIPNFVFEVKYAYLDKIIGQKIEPKTLHGILRSLEIEVIEPNQEGFVVSVPPYRVDVKRPADIAEEVLRIYGFDNIGLSEHNSADFLSPFPKKDPDKIQSQTAAMLAASGFFQMVTSSLSKESYWKKFDWLDQSTAVAMLNPLSEDYSILRQSPVPSMLEVIAHNLNRKQKSLKLFEIAKTYHKTDRYQEREYLSLAICGLNEEPNWQSTSQKADFFALKASVAKVLQFFSVQKYQIQESQSPYFSYGLQYKQGKEVLVELGLLKPSICKYFDIKQEVFFAELDWAKLLSAWGKAVVYEPVPRYPVVERDLSLVIDKKISFQELETIARKTEKSILQHIRLFDVYQGANLGDDTKKAYALSFSLVDKEKTLTDEVIDKTLQKLIGAFEKEAGAVIRK